MDRMTSDGENTMKKEAVVGTDNREKEKEEHKQTLLDPDECLTEEECTTDEDDDTEEMFPVDDVDEDDADEEQATTDTGPDVLPFAGFASAATGVQLPTPSTEALEHAKKVLGIAPEASGTGVHESPAPPQQYPPQEVCFRRASNGEKWFLLTD